ncbi:MAG TPA: TatD family hydrolase [Cyclobacteriaceae bacterium]|jgi:TatD DNase family protein|nr:TatD family hydrolase [Cytophagales bacterium]HNT51594.1 TatD family hydrolase [Cyclobacteriaceae bacterium]HRE68721.1 TatD family hydrolase [Cyclobacteriaceae bacterium]HRF34884.1 TatD family hydrolase [Cyclobacteriaceae bacterium]
MSFWIDTHAHIYVKEFDADRADVLARCTELQVEKIYMPNIDHASIDLMLEVEAKYPQQCLPMMGLHPCSVKKDFEKELYLVENWLTKRRFAALGEMGTDLYWDKTFWEQQQEAFKIQTGWAKKYQLPLVIHCRESIDETIALLEPFAGFGLTGVFHCFSGTAEQAKKIYDLGFYVGIGGVATFKNGGMDAVIPNLAIDRIVLETDSPYLAPVPHRGKRNTPEYIPLIAARIAALKNISVERLMQHTYSNTCKLFDK